MVLVKLASSTDIQAAVVLHPGPITEDEIDGKSPTAQANAK
jgi:carboxymethylenebutenolidase